MTNPAPGTPFIPDIDTGLWWDLDAAALVGFSDGDPVSTVSPYVADFSALTFSVPSGIGAISPTYSGDNGPGGRPCIEFDPYSVLASGTLENYGGPLSVIIDARINAYASSSSDQARLMSYTGSVPKRININGQVQSGTFITPAKVINSGASPTDWTTIIAVFDGSNSRLCVGAGPVLEGEFDEGNSNLFSLGATHNVARNGTGLNGAYSRFRAYRRAFTADEVAAIRDLYSVRG